MSIQGVYFDKSFYRVKIPSHNATFHNPQAVQPHLITMTTNIPRKVAGILSGKNFQCYPVLPYWEDDWLQRPHLASPFPWALNIW